MPEEIVDQTSDFKIDMDLLDSDESSPVEPVAEEPEEKSGEAEEEPEEKPREEIKEEEPEVIRHSRPTVNQIKAKYPEFFKEFPDMRHMLFREGEYATLFPTVDDAKDASAKADDFDRLSSLVTSTKVDDTTEFLKALEPKDLKSLSSNFLPALFKSDRDTYYSVVNPIAESLIRNAYKAAINSGDKNLEASAQWLAKWAFGDFGFATGEKTTIPEVTETKVDTDLEREKQEFFQTKYNDAQGYVKTNATSRIKSEIKKGLDPNGVFNEFTTDLLINRVIDEMSSQLEADTQHMSTMNSLWKQASKAGFTGNWKDRILSTYLSRARVIMPAIRTRVRSAAMSQKEREAENRAATADKSANRKELGGSSSASPGKPNGRIDARQVDWSKTSDMDILNDKPTLRKV